MENVESRGEILSIDAAVCCHVRICTSPNHHRLAELSLCNVQTEGALNPSPTLRSCRPVFHSASHDRISHVHHMCIKQIELKNL